MFEKLRIITNSEKNKIKISPSTFEMIQGATMCFEQNCIGFAGNLVSVCFVIKTVSSGHQVSLF